mmetsp:Transcript_17196/g.66926  ORF Transcript_17196/g.66926 Transcript_17196/m.66926 type:complete len:472 (+) Transcript_17196:28-1443(+)
MHNTYVDNETIDWTPVTWENSGGLTASGNGFSTNLFPTACRDAQGNPGLMLSASTNWSVPKTSIEGPGAWESLDRDVYSRLFNESPEHEQETDSGEGATATAAGADGKEGEYEFAVEPSIAADISAMLSEDFPASTVPATKPEPVEKTDQRRDTIMSLLSQAAAAPTTDLGPGAIKMAETATKRPREGESPLFPPAKKVRPDEPPPGFVTMASLETSALKEPEDTTPASQFLARSSQNASKLLSESSSGLIRQFLTDCSSGELKALMTAAQGTALPSDLAVSSGNSFGKVLAVLGKKNSSSGITRPLSCAQVTTAACVRMYHRSKGNHKWEETNTAPPKLGKMRKLTVTVANPMKAMRVLCRVVDISNGPHKSTCLLSTRSSCKKEELVDQLELSVPRSPEPITVFCFLKPTWGAKTAHVPRFSVEVSLLGEVGKATLHSFDFAVASHKYESNTGRKFAAPSPVSTVVVVS